MTQREADWAEKEAIKIFSKIVNKRNYTHDRRRELLAEALRRVRDETIEECAKAAFESSTARGAVMAGKAIRALKAKGEA